MSPKLVTLPCIVMDGGEIYSERDDEPVIYRRPVEMMGREEVHSLDAYFPDEFVKKRVGLFMSGHLLWLHGVLNGSSIFVIDAWFMRQPLA